MSGSNKLFGLGLIGLSLLLVSCRESVIPTSLPTKVIPVFKPIPTPTPYSYATATPRVRLFENQIDVEDSHFSPAVLTVTVGSVVHWNHVGVIVHNVEAVDRTWGTTFLPVGSGFEYTFTREGMYEYICLFHAPGMRGTIVVIRP